MNVSLAVKDRVRLPNNVWHRSMGQRNWSGLDVDPNEIHASSILIKSPETVALNMSASSKA